MTHRFRIDSRRDVDRLIGRAGNSHVSVPADVHRNRTCRGIQVSRLETVAPKPTFEPTATCAANRTVPTEARATQSIGCEDDAALRLAERSRRGLQADGTEPAFADEPADGRGRAGQKIRSGGDSFAHECGIKLNPRDHGSAAAAPERFAFASREIEAVQRESRRRLEQMLESD